MATAKKNDSDQHEKIRLLLIDDEADNFAGMFDQGLRSFGFESAFETNPDRTASAIGKHRPHVILLDLHFPDDDLRTDGATTGGKLLSEIFRDFPGIPVVIFTSRLSDTDISLETNLQPHGWFGKNQISEMQETNREWAPILAQALNSAIAIAETDRKIDDSDMGFVVGNTDAMRRVAKAVRSAATHNMMVLIFGKTGTGKTGVAQAIHRLSGRKGRFEHLNCSGVNEETLTDLLFGHVRGAYTGAVGEKQGLFELANGGTLFLDEIQAMPRALQNHLMTVVENSVIRRMGGDKDIAVDVRLIVATNQPLVDLVDDEILREDLAWRLHQFLIELPTLRERVQDMPALWQHLIGKANEKLNKHVTDVLRPEVLEILRAHDWPGNIRELEAVIARAVATTRSNVLLPQDIEIVPLTTTSKSMGSSSIEVNQSATAAVNGAAMESSLEVQAVDIAVKIDGMAVQNRYSFITGNFDGELRRLVLIEIVRILRSRQGRKVRHKELASYLDVIKDADKNFERIRQMVITAGVQLTKLECNQ